MGQSAGATTSLEPTNSPTTLKSTGGSVEFKADQNQFEVRLGLTEALATAVKESLVNAGYDPLSLDDLVDAG
jgi:hypothetical protein